MRKIPFRDLFNPTLHALRQLGGSGTNQEIHDAAVIVLGLTDEEIAELYKPDQSNQTRIAYRLAWARTYLKRYGLLENSSRGVWSLTPEGQSTSEIDSKEVERVVNKQLQHEKQAQPDGEQSDSKEADETLPETDDPALDARWRDQLYSVLTTMDPTAFERLCQRLLRESGFTKVEVTQASYDGGIDGKGLLQVHEFLTFRVEFQCKRYSGSVGPDVVRNLRGAMSGSADRGLIVSTGNFTKGAVQEATREDKIPIELVDGEDLIDRLNELELGVSTEMVPKVTVDPDFFKNI